MSVIAEVTIPARQFVLGDLLEVREGVRIRLESVIPTGQQRLPYFWVDDPDVEPVLSALEASTSVAEAEVVDRVDDAALFRVVWAEDVDGVIEAIETTDCAVLGGDGFGDVWRFELRFPAYDDLSAFYRDLTDKDIGVELLGIHDPVEQPGSPGVALTAEQREALETALDSGYFAVPREATLVELAEQLGISDSAVSQRLRRGLTKLLRRTFLQE